MSKNKLLPFENDKISEECGIFGIFGSSEAHLLTALGLHALQHRGQEATGMVSFDGKQFKAKRGLGHVSENFNAASMKMDELAGYAAIGHNRYSTTGQSEIRNIQPFLTELAFGDFAIAHNGNLTNAERVRGSLIDTGSLFQSTTDTETIIHLIARSKRNKVEERIKEALLQIEGAYALIALVDNMMIGIRDPLGVRPLILGKLNNSYILTSETCALDIIGAEYIRDIESGEMVLITENSVKSWRISEPLKSRFCIFEYIYFSRPDSVINQKSVYNARKMIGTELARESKVLADLVIPVPDSGVPAALGYAQESGIRFEFGIIRNHYIGRTFIQPSQDARSSGVMMKHNANANIISGKDIILVDDSIVRGTTSRKIVKMMREAGAKSVHMRIASPPTTNPCFYGVDTPSKENLIAAQLNLEDIRNEIEADSLAFISIHGLYRAMGETKRNTQSPQYCDACFTGDYPIAPSRNFISGSKNNVS